MLIETHVKPDSLVGQWVEVEAARIVSRCKLFGLVSAVASIAVACLAFAMNHSTSVGVWILLLAPIFYRGFSVMGRFDAEALRARADQASGTVFATDQGQLAKHKANKFITRGRFFGVAWVVGSIILGAYFVMDGSWVAGCLVLMCAPFSYRPSCRLGQLQAQEFLRSIQNTVVKETQLAQAA